MKRCFILCSGLVLFLFIANVYSAQCTTEREYYYHTPEANVWLSTVCPGSPVAFHTHQTTRVVIPQNNGKLRIQYKDGSRYNLNLKKGVPVMLMSKEGQRLHQDVNLEKFPLKMIVVEMVKQKK